MFSKSRQIPAEMRDQIFLTDGGLETVMLFVEGIELAHFAACPLCDNGAGGGVRA